MMFFKHKNKKRRTIRFLPYLLNSLEKCLKSLVIFVSNFLRETYKTISYATIGLLKVFDFIIINLIKIFSYFIYGIFYAVKFTYEYIVIIISFIYNHSLKYIIIELKLLFIAIYKGTYKVFKIVFYDFPIFIFNAFSDFFDLVSKKIKIYYQKTSQFVKRTPNKIKKYFLNKWNSISVVKHYKNKRERELEVLLIDKFGKDAERTSKKMTYKYLARNSEGNLVTGYFAALSKLDVHSYLLDNGFEVYSIKTNWWINFVHGQGTMISNQMRNKKLIFWLTQLSTYLKSGIPLTDSVKILAQQDKSKKLKKVYDSIIYELSIGESFSEALNKQNGVFPPLLINMIKASELIGDLESTLDDMSKYYEEKEETRRQMISALTYPSLVLIFAVVVISFMVLYIVPQFENVYKSMNAEITGLTLFLINASAFLKNNITIIVVGALLIAITYSVLYKKVKAFRTVMQYIFMHLPVVGNLIIYNEINLFAKTFAVLNKNNVLLTDSIDILSKITSNEFYKMIMYDTISNLLRGEKVSLSFKDNWAIPSLAYYMISTGEQTGELSTMLEKVSDYYQKEQRTLAGTLKTLIEPALIATLAVVVGGIMVAILVPMYSIGSEILR